MYKSVPFSRVQCSDHSFLVTPVIVARVLRTHKIATITLASCACVLRVKNNSKIEQKVGMLLPKSTKKRSRTLHYEVIK